MNKYFIKIWSQTKKMFLTVAVTVLVAVLAALVLRYSISRAVLILSLLYMLIGLGSLLGGIGVTIGTSYLQAKSVGAKSGIDKDSEDYKSRNSSNKFMIFMFIAGIFLMVIGFVLDAFYL